MRVSRLRTMRARVKVDQRRADDNTINVTQAKSRTTSPKCVNCSLHSMLHGTHSLRVITSQSRQITRGGKLQTRNKK